MPVGQKDIAATCATSRSGEVFQAVGEPDPRRLRAREARPWCEATNVSFPVEELKRRVPHGRCPPIRALGESLVGVLRR
jgi:hypothetical protein